VVILTFDRYAAHEFERFAVLDQKVAIATVLVLYLALLAGRRSESIALAFAGGLAIGYLFVDKGTFLIAGAGIAIVFVALGVASRRFASSLAVIVGIALGFVALWLLAGQSLANVPDYFRTTYDIVVGYTPAMSGIDY